MRFVYGKQDWATRERGQENGYLLTNGLGGFSAGSMINGNTRNDHALLMACLRAPNLRYNMINRTEEFLETGSEKTKVYLSSQESADPERTEDGYRRLNGFVWEDYPEWTFQAGGVEVVKRLVMAQGKNLVAVEYRADNRTDEEVWLKVVPHVQFVPKGAELKGKPAFEITEIRQDREMPGYSLWEIRSGGLAAAFQTNGHTERFPARFCEGDFYAADARDGRNSEGRTCVLCRIGMRIPASQCKTLEIVYRVGEGEIPLAEDVFREAAEYREQLLAEASGSLICQKDRAARRQDEAVFESTARGQGEAAFEGGARRQGGAVFEGADGPMSANGSSERASRQEPVNETALQLAMAASQFISERESTGGKTILAGYPFFEDWGRDTMIALEGCCMAAGQLETARSILRTFAAYCRKGLMPNLFPEGEQKPRYNTADAALLFINSVYALYERTGDRDFVREMWPVMREIIEAYRGGTDHGIRMDADGLIRAGEGLDQVTWMDVRIGDHLPTPRHGKPVEINAYWYNALKIMEALEPCAAEERGGDGLSFGSLCGRLAERVRSGFREKFWIGEKGYLKDVLSGTAADEQFRCNQIWAVSLPFTMLDEDQERQIVDKVYEKLYTPYGLRTLAPDDPEFRGAYGGPMRERDLAYHQGTVWVFPLGAYYLAYLKTRGYSAEAAAQVKWQLRVMESALREGCIGQLPEIYDGENPSFSRGCFAQAWSVGEILRVYEALERYGREESEV